MAPASPLAPDLAAAQLPQELALAHTLIMKSVALGDVLLDRSAREPASPAGLKAALAAMGLANLTARLMHRTRRGTLLLSRLPATERRAAGDPQPALAPVGGQPSAPKLYAAPGLARGRLNNGNPAGDFLAAPRCGARTRAGCACRQPAMANGRCRFHGGLSTGPRTAAGLARCRTARLAHGGRTRAVIAFRSRAAHSARRLGGLIRAAAPRPAGHGLHRSNLGGVRKPSSVVCPPSSAGHGLHRSESSAPASTGQHRPATPSVFIRLHLRSSASHLAMAPAGHGVHRPACA
jgi:hypothetical protein